MHGYAEPHRSNMAANPSNCTYSLGIGLTKSVYCRCAPK